MTNETNSSILTTRAEVERLFGRCLLQLQAYERLMKAILSQHRLAGSAATLEKATEKRAASFDRQTLGALVGQMMGSAIVDDETQEPHSLSDEGSEIDVRMWIVLRPDDFATSEADLRNLVTLRNNLVHHFLDDHDLHSPIGCEKARLSLVEALQQITKASNTLRMWATDFVKLRSTVTDMLNTPEVRNAIIGKTSE